MYSVTTTVGGHVYVSDSCTPESTGLSATQFAEEIQKLRDAVLDLKSLQYFMIEQDGETVYFNPQHIVSVTFKED